MVDHASLTGAALHESKGVATATAKTVYVADGAGSGSWTTLDFATLPTGTVLQMQYATSTTATNLTTTMPFDSTTPQNTEGTQIFSVSITPKVSTSLIVIEVCVPINESSNSASQYCGALFKDSDANALSAVVEDSSGFGNMLYLKYITTAGSTSARTYKFRAGPNGGSTTYTNIGFGSVTMGGTIMSTMTVTEIKA